MNPFSAMSNQEHAKALAEIFVCLHLGACRRPADIEDQASAMLRLYNRQQGVRLGSYLDGCHFEAWQDRDGFVFDAANCGDVQDMAYQFLAPEGWCHVETACGE